MRIVAIAVPFKEFMNKSLEQLIQETFIKKKLTLSTAESCTGGAIASKLTKIPGCSQYFIGSVVAYSNELKMKLLHIDPEILTTKGAVSKEVVIQMADGIKHITGSDFSVAVTGIAGPTGGTPEKPVGTIWAAIGQKDQKPYAWSFKIEGNRIGIIEKTVDVVLNELWRLLQK